MQSKELKKDKFCDVNRLSLINPIVKMRHVFIFVEQNKTKVAKFIFCLRKGKKTGERKTGSSKLADNIHFNALAPPTRVICFFGLLGSAGVGIATFFFLRPPAPHDDRT